MVDNEKEQKDMSTNTVAEIHNAFAWNKIGIDASDTGKLGEYQKAIEDYTEAIRLKLKYYEAIYNRALAYGNLNQKELAIEDFNRVLSIKPDHADAYCYRGIAYFIMGKKLLAYNDAKIAAALESRLLLEDIKHGKPLIEND
ncbi:MAG TPA: tetratricopeptide repeat protein [Smithella sp.]|nr:tetratricopeptide repeat protein [Smithella sp.]